MAQSKISRELVTNLIQYQCFFMMILAYKGCDDDLDQDHLHVIQERLGKWYEKELRLSNHAAKAEKICAVVFPRFQAMKDEDVPENGKKFGAKIGQLVKQSPDSSRFASRIVRDWVHVVARDGRITPMERNLVVSFSSSLNCSSQLVNQMIDQECENRRASASTANDFASQLPPMPSSSAPGQGSDPAASTATSTSSDTSSKFSSGLASMMPDAPETSPSPSSGQSDPSAHKTHLSQSVADFRAGLSDKGRSKSSTAGDQADASTGSKGDLLDPSGPSSDTSFGAELLELSWLDDEESDVSSADSVSNPATFPCQHCGASIPLKAMYLGGGKAQCPQCNRWSFDSSADPNGGGLDLNLPD
ncbi:MAG: hypothetical protein CMJ39_07160 [Phycisphaerae bacterium]|nr:hypothetical protein [Phycisphaerae bacterium]